MSSGVQRKLATILAADAEGYSRAMGTDELGTLAALRSAREVFASLIERHGGRIVNTAGDGLIAEFPSVVEAVQCAIEVQRELAGAKKKSDKNLNFRIGVHLGDVLIDGTDLLGEGVNLAARLQTMAEPGGILISQQVYDQVHGKLSIRFDYLGQRRPKNFTEDITVYRVELDGKRRPARKRTTEPPHSDKPPHSVGGGGQLTEDQRTRVIRHGKALGIVWAALVVMDVFTGSPFWAHWPGIAIATLWALEATPLFLDGWFWRLYARGAVVVVALAVINIITWADYPWVLWPAGVLIATALIHRFAKQPT